MVSQPMTLFGKAEGDRAPKGFGSARKENFHDKPADTQYLPLIVLYNLVSIKRQRKE